MDDPFENDAPEAAAPPPKKRSLFSSATIAKSNAAEEAVEFFSRAKELHPQMLAQEERRRQKRLLKLERKRSSTSADTKEITPPEEKRRRVSAQAKSHDTYSSDESQNHDIDDSSRTRRQSSHSSPGSRRSRHGSDPHVAQASGTTLSASYNREINARKQQLPKPGISTGCITLSDSESDSAKTTLPVRKPAKQHITLIDSDDDLSPLRKPTKPIVEDDNQFSDEEFPEIVAAAKERARKKAEEAARLSKAFAEQNHAQNGDRTQDLDDIFDTASGLADADPSVEILITSVMAGTNPLRVKRRISQKLAEVRHAWCDRQSFEGQPMGPDFKDQVFLTWKNIRVFDYTTCKGLGLKVDGLGNLVSGGDSIDPDGRVHLEAWTEDAFAIYQKRQEAKKKKAQGHDNSDGLEEQKEPPVKRTKLVLKSKDLPEYKLMVKPSTTVQRMIEAFKDANSIPDEKTVTLHFDGDKLELSDTVEDTELGDMDTVEVHIR
ncbi:hypothetical protein EG329_001592 [Mollisiaceae sp. DMI_Dod_QoI]|nr:hypothetical protein EG329_001592 [Helotiales sp. DMI_Dod_QoI]